MRFGGGGAALACRMLLSTTGAAFADRESLVVAGSAQRARDEIHSNSKLRKKCEANNGSFCKFVAEHDVAYSASNQEQVMAKLYDKYHTNRGSAEFEPANDLVIRLLQRHYAAQQFPAVLDAGVGQCHMIRALMKAGYSHVRGQEISAYAIRHFCSGLMVSQGLLKNMSAYAKEEFDITTSIDVVEHIPPSDIEATFAEIRRVTRHLFIFKVGPCAKNCGGFCALDAVHPSGLCEALPYSW